MISFDLKVFYAGEDTQSFKHGKMYLLSYIYDFNYEKIDILGNIIELPLLSIINIDQSYTSDGNIFNDVRLKDFKSETEWELIDRDNRLLELLNLDE